MTVPQHPTVAPWIVELEREHGRFRGALAMTRDERAEQLRGDERRVAREDEHVVGSTVEQGPGASHGVSRTERLLLNRSRRPIESVSVRRGGDDDERIDSRAPGCTDHPVHHTAPEQRVEMLRHARAHTRAEACGHDDCCDLGFVHRAVGGWGARIRTWDHGTKTRCLTTWPRPSEMPGRSVCHSQAAGIPIMRPATVERPTFGPGPRAHVQRAPPHLDPRTARRPRAPLP